MDFDKSGSMPLLYDVPELWYEYCDKGKYEYWWLVYMQ